MTCEELYCINMESKPLSENPEEGNKKAFAILGYVLPILFFLPLLNEQTKNDVFARFHANQQLILLLVYGVLTFALNLFVMSVYLVVNLVQLIHIVLIGFALYGAYYAYKGEMKELPVIGHFRIL